MVLHKTSWRAMSRMILDGSVDVMSATEHAIVVKDGQGACANIDFLPSDEASKILGCWISLLRNQEHHDKATLEAAQLARDLVLTQISYSVSAH